MPEPTLDPSRCNNLVLRQASRRMGQLYDDALAPAGLRATQYALLMQATHLREPTMRELADAMVMDLSALGHSLKPLTRDGFVELVADARDRRAKRVTLTPAGRARLEEARVLWRGVQDGFEAAFGAERAAELRSVLGFLASDAFSERFHGRGGSEAA